MNGYSSTCCTTPGSSSGHQRLHALAARLLVALTGATAGHPLLPALAAGALLEPLALPPAGWHVTFPSPAVTAIVSRRADGLARPGAAGAVRAGLSARAGGFGQRPEHPGRGVLPPCRPPAPHPAPPPPNPASRPGVEPQ